MTELENIIDKFFRKSGKGIVVYNLEQDTLNKVLENVETFERPDMISKFDDKIIGIEHFEFDSYNRSRKGSEFKQEEFRTGKELDSRLQEKLTDNKKASVGGVIKSKRSLDNYYKNFKDILEEHYKKIDDYIEHIKQKYNVDEEKIHLCFFAEDVTPLGNYYIDSEDKPKLVLPIFSKEVIELLRKCPKIEYLIVGTYCMNEYKLVIIENKEKVLSQFLKENESPTKENYMNMEPHIFEYGTIFSKEDMQDLNNTKK